MFSNASNLTSERLPRTNTCKIENTSNIKIKILCYNIFEIKRAISQQRIFVIIKEAPNVFISAIYGSTQKPITNKESKYPLAKGRSLAF